MCAETVIDVSRRHPQPNQGSVVSELNQVGLII
jgi:hypothetical protein